jgi:UDP-MurNAc hydroxylase
VRATSIGHAGILIETRQATIVCDPWFVPAFFGSWFVFPRNDQLGDELMHRITHPDYLYVSHLHGDHFDEPFLAEHMSRNTTVLLPGFPGHELEEQFRRLGFERFLRTRDGVELDLGDGLSVAIHVETSITDGPGGDSAIVVSDGRHRLVNQNDCRTNDLGALAAHGPVDLHFLQFSGAIWYPMVYDEPPERMRQLVDAKVESQFARALRYVESLDARFVVPSAGPPCFLDEDLYGFNVITGEELSIFPDQTEFLARLAASGRERGILNIPGTAIDLDGDIVTVTHPQPDHEVAAIFSDKDAYLRRYQADWAGWLAECRAGWHGPTDDLVSQVQRWWEPLLAMAPTLRDAVGGSCLIRAGGAEGDPQILVDFPAGTVRAYDGEPYRFRFDIPRPLVETVVAARAVDWSNSLLLSCRFRAWRDGEFNEYLYNFLKSLSPDRMRRAEAEARQKLAPPTTTEEIELGGYVMERWCPHRRADLTVFGEIEDGELVCTLHGWRFDLETGRCLTAKDRRLRVRSADQSDVEG